VPTNISENLRLEEVARFLRLLAQPTRIKILLVISNQEACVCHLEAYLGERQATISQHLMILRDAGLVITNRDGHNIYYRLAKPDLQDLVIQAARFIGLSPADIQLSVSKPVSPCPCPHCNVYLTEGE
jgi:DNA-binding transcriptional ArsR family regulator